MAGRGSTIGATQLNTLFSVLRDPRARALGLAGAAGAFLAIAIPTAVWPNPFFVRMTPARPLDYLFLGLTAAGAGLLAATYARPSDAPAQRGMFGGFLAFLAIGCPVCNKLVILALGVSGALTYFEPLQPVLGVASVVLVGTALAARLRGIERCAL